MCGWCMTGHHDKCKPKIEYYEKIWYCKCGTCEKIQTEKGPSDEKASQLTEELPNEELTSSSNPDIQDRAIREGQEESSGTDR